MKTILIAAGLSLAATSALADIPLGLGNVSASLTTTATYDSNVYGTRDATADYFGTLAPKVSYSRKAGEIEAEANAGISLIRYLDQTQLNADNLDADVSLKIPESDIRNYTGLLSAAYVEASTVDTEINARINSKTSTFIGQGAFVTGPRSDLALSGNYSDAQRSVASSQQILTSEATYDYKDFFAGNSLRVIGDYDELHSSGGNSLGVPLDQHSIMLSAGLGRAFVHDTLRAGISYGYRILERSAAETTSGVRQEDGSVISASLEGPFLPEKYFPKVTSSFAVVYQEATSPGINDTGSSRELTGNLSLAWQARSTTKATFSAKRTQNLSANDLSVVSTEVDLGVEQVLRYNLTGSLTAGYNWSSYRTISRQDKIASLGARLAYHFARSWEGDFTYDLTSVNSSDRLSTLDRQVVSLSLAYQF